MSYVYNISFYCIRGTQAHYLIVSAPEDLPWPSCSDGMNSEFEVSQEDLCEALNHLT